MAYSNCSKLDVAFVGASLRGEEARQSIEVPGCAVGVQQPSLPNLAPIHTLPHPNAFGHHECKEVVKEWQIPRQDKWIRDPQWLTTESWLDDHPDFCLDYFLR